MKNDKNLKLSEFCLELARELIEEYGSKWLQMRGRSSTDSPLRVIACHFIAFILEDNFQKHCFVCSHTVKREKNEVRQYFIAQIAMLHYVTPPASKNIIQ